MDKSEFEKIFKSHAESIHNYLFFLSGNTVLAKDLTQDTFLKIWDKRDEIQVSRVKGLLFSIAKNLYLDNHKHQKVKYKYWSSYVEKYEQEDPEFLLVKKEFHNILLNAIESLPEGPRIVFLMSRIEKLKYKEIAQRLNLSVKAVEKRMSIALRTLHHLHKKI